MCVCVSTYSLLPCRGCYKQCCCEHWGACIFLNWCFPLSGYTPRNGIAGSYGNSSVLWNLHTVLPGGRINLYPHQLCVAKSRTRLKRLSSSSNYVGLILFSPQIIVFVTCKLFDDGHSDRWKVTPHCSLIFIYLIISDVECLFMCLLAICLTNRKWSFRSSAHFLIRLFIVWILSQALGKFRKLGPCWSHHVQYFLAVYRLSFFLFMVSFSLQKLIDLIRPHLFIFAFVSISLGDWPKRTLLWFMSDNVLPLFSSRSFMMLCLTFKPLSHFEFIFVYYVRMCSNFIDLHALPSFLSTPCWRNCLFSPLHIPASFV